MTRLLHSFHSVIDLLATDQSLLVTSNGPVDLLDRQTWPSDILRTKKGDRLARELELLVEHELASVTDRGIEIPTVGFETIIGLGLQTPKLWTPWSPYSLYIESCSSIGNPDFAYRYRYFLGNREAYVERSGAYLYRPHDRKHFLLDPQTLALVQSMDDFNSRVGADREGAQAWIAFKNIKGIATGVGAQLDAYLEGNDVLVPPKVGVEVVEGVNGEISIMPVCEGVPYIAMRGAFTRSREDQDIYHIDKVDGGRIRVVLEEGPREVFNRMRRAQRVRGDQGEQLKANPELLFEGLINFIHPAYSRRVEGIGDWRPAPVPKPAASSSLLDPEGALIEGFANEPGGMEELLKPDAPFRTPVEIDLPPVPPSKVGSRLKIKSPLEAERFVKAMGQAQQNGEDSFEFNGARVPVDPDLLSDLNGEGEHQGGVAKKYLLIYTDEEELRQPDQKEVEAILGESNDQEAHWQYVPPRSLMNLGSLKPHQEAAVAWLQRCIKQGRSRRGSLLADEMGLGKTLEVLTFLAWCIETDAFEGLSLSAGPFRPILVIAPLMLVENQTWQQDIEKFFTRDCFGPVLSLTSENIAGYRMHSGRETVIGRPVLDLSRIQGHRMVITNYDTLTNYQHSFAQMRDGHSIWSVVVTDEAQSFKTPNSRRSHAIKALHPDLHIACTGTPVENRLLDLWNLMDALQPSLLGSAQDFSRRYEREIGNEGERERLAELRERLHYQRPTAFILRREKAILPGFPKKVELPTAAPMPSAVVDEHLRLLNILKLAEGHKGIHLACLHRLVDLYQHPLSRQEEFEDLPASVLIEKSTKLQDVIQTLTRIQAAGEKAIVFARHIKIQQMLAKVIEASLGVRVSIINGQPPAAAIKASAPGLETREYRKVLLDRFRQQQGFGVIILSPHVAGVGLTITEANHVIHYGRWWNPAVEAQATDRVYRIGQSKTVHVHLPIWKDPTGRLSASFDEKLHELLERKRSMARDFLLPGSSESEAEQELMRELQFAAQRGDQADVDHRLGIDDLDLLDHKAFDRLVDLAITRKGWSTRSETIVILDQSFRALNTREGIKVIGLYYESTGKDLPKFLSALSNLVRTHSAGAKGYVLSRCQLEGGNTKGWPEEIEQAWGPEWFRDAFHEQWPRWSELLSG